ncbi:MAG: hypothetical protein AABX34_05235, partial [Nanoarchaeota archaeon]
SRGESISEASTSISTANSMHHILANNALGYESTSSTSAKKSKITFECNQYSVEGVSKNIKDIILFSPNSINSGNILIAKFNWHFPYNAGNFLYLTSPEIRYIFIGDSEFARKAFQTTPANIKKDGYTNAQAVQNEGHKEARLIFFDNNPEIPSTIKNQEIKITAIKVIGNEQHGDLEFFNFEDDGFIPNGASKYIGMASLFGAVFSDDISRYKCNMEKAFLRLNAVSSVYFNKSNFILDEYGKNGNELCLGLYSNTTKLSDSLRLLSSAEFDEQKIDGLIIAANDVKKINEEANALSCATIY